MKQYLDLVKHVIKNGVGKDDRTGTGTKSVFGYQIRFDLQKGFPMLTTMDTNGAIGIATVLTKLPKLLS